MKIGILTFQHSINFGAQLQCYALQEVIKGLGHEVSVINYFPSKVSRLPFYKKIYIRKVGVFNALKIFLIKLRYVDRMRKSFDSFQNDYINLTERCDINSIGNTTKPLDAIVVGSDQVWGSYFHDESIYFLGWQPEFSGKRISFAPCCGHNKVDEKNKSTLALKLNRFNSLSVRNPETFSLVNNLTGKSPEIVLDPTFLHDFSEFKDKFVPPYKKYILTYVLGEEINGGHEKVIQKIREKRGNLPVITIILTESNIKIFSWSTKTYWDVDPFDWVSLIANADFLYTDSFHGIVFALKFNIPFLAYYTEEKRAARLLDLASRFSLRDYIISQVADLAEKPISSSDASYNETNDYINKQLTISYDFLSKALKND